MKNASSMPRFFFASKFVLVEIEKKEIEKEKYIERKCQIFIVYLRGEIKTKDALEQ